MNRIQCRIPRSLTDAIRDWGHPEESLSSAAQRLLSHLAASPDPIAPIMPPATTEPRDRLIIYDPPPNLLHTIAHSATPLADRPRSQQVEALLRYGLSLSIQRIQNSKNLEDWLRDHLTYAPQPLASVIEEIYPAAPRRAIRQWLHDLNRWMLALSHSGTGTSILIHGRPYDTIQLWPRTTLRYSDIRRLLYRDRPFPEHWQPALREGIGITLDGYCCAILTRSPHAITEAVRPQDCVTAQHWYRLFRAICDRLGAPITRQNSPMHHPAYRSLPAATAIALQYPSHLGTLYLVRPDALAQPPTLGALPM